MPALRRVLKRRARPLANKSSGDTTDANECIDLSAAVPDATVDFDFSEQKLDADGAAKVHA